MSIVNGKVQGAPVVLLMPDYVPFESLWKGDNAPYPSEHSARWAVRKLRPELAQAQAMALLRGRTMLHPQRFAEVVERSAIAEYSNSPASHHQD